MAKAKPKAWFTSPIAKITFRSVDKWAEQNRSWRPYFADWHMAHAWMMAKATDRLKKAKAELKSAAAHGAKVKAMQPPQEASDA